MTEIPILSNEKGKKILLMGNEAIVRGALESGVGFASTYPGTPSSEVGDTFSMIAKDAGIYFEYSTNEKVALEAAMGASFSGVRSIVSVKQYGINVAADSLMPLAYVGPKAGMVIMVADDPGCWSSAQSEQDTRYYSRLGHIPMLEPSSPQECKDFVKIAFKLSEKFEVPVFVRTTTRVSHGRGVIKLGELIKGKTKGLFEKDMKKFNMLPPHTMEVHDRVLEKMERIREISEKTKLNFVENKGRRSDWGIITSGVSYNYVMDALEDFNLKIPVLKLGLTYPVPKKKIQDFIKRYRSVLIVEELEPVLEEEVNKLAKNVNPKLKVYGKNILPESGEFKEEFIINTIERLTKKKFRIGFEQHMKKYKKLKMPRRFAVMCSGCPHRATFWSVKKAAGRDTIFGGDIGCYILGMFPPYDLTDFFFSMGASPGIVHGIKKTSFQKVISFIGDSTFFHASIPAVINTVFNKSNPLIIIMDNRITGMTGHQPNPGTGRTGMGDPSEHIRIEDIIKAIGVKNVAVVDPYNVKKMIKTVKKFLKKKDVSVIVAKRECRLLTVRRFRKFNKKLPKFEINPKKCKKCGTCLYLFACPAIYKEGDQYKIDKNLCWGCGVCAQVCPNHAIKAVKR